MSAGYFYEDKPGNKNTQIIRVQIYVTTPELRLQASDDVMPRNESNELQLWLGVI